MHFLFQPFQVNMYESWIFVQLQAARPVAVLVFLHILRGEAAANCDEASQLGIWLRNSREAKTCVGGRWWKSRSWSNMVKWFAAPRQPQKVRGLRVFGIFDTSFRFRAAVRWAMKSLYSKWCKTFPQCLAMPADSIILDFQYSDCLAFIASVRNRPLSQISSLGLRDYLQAPPLHLSSFI